MTDERWSEIARRAHTCLSVPSGMVGELLDYTEELRMKLVDLSPDGIKQDEKGHQFS